MDWETFADNLYPLVIPLLVTAVALYIQGQILLNPKKEKVIGQSLIAGFKWLASTAVAVLALAFIFDQLALWLK